MDFGKYSAPALEKGLDILELLANEPSGMSKTEIANKLDRTINEIFRMLVVLEGRGFIWSSNQTDKYTLTLKMFELSHKNPPIKKLTSASSDIIKELSADLKQSCHIAVYYSGKGHVVAQQDAPTDVVFSVRLGVEVKLFGSCSGHILFAFSTETEREQMLKDIPKGHPRPSRSEIEELVQRVTAQGYESMASLRTANAFDFGFPIFDHTGSVAASIVVPFLPRIGEDMAADEDTIIDQLRIASSKISSSLGFEQTES
ncbi:MAG: IclR family transcriptional regulator [Sphingomonadales bacterium]|nr:IclR family transcriptional regulator [Sphingomonadales bacterium]